MRIDFKAFPIIPHPAFPSQTIQWRPVLNVVVFYGHNRSRRIEAIVDSGSDYCLFHSSIGASLGMDVESGIEGDLGGVIGGVRSKMYYHKVKLLTAGEYIDVTAGFSPSLSVPALLGQVGFFDQCVVTFDYAPHPPCFELQRIHRS